MRNAFTLTLVCLLLAAPAGMGQPKSQKGATDEQAGGMKELTEFHEVLHPCVHEYMPKGDLDAVRGKLDLLSKKAVSIQKARIPKEFASRSKDFDRLSAQLTKQVNELKGLKDKEAFTKAFDAMHETYEELAGLVR